MRITIAAVGRAKRGAEQALCDSYLRRLSASGLAEVTIKEVEERRALPPDELKQREARLLEAALPQGARLVALDPRGRTLSSEDFAARLGAIRDEGIADLCFVIGGADGLAAPLVARADWVLSLGAMTWPHLLARVLLVEQLFRAQAILTGHPYHRA